MSPPVPVSEDPVVVCARTLLQKSSSVRRSIASGYRFARYAAYTKLGPCQRVTELSVVRLGGHVTDAAQPDKTQSTDGHKAGHEACRVADVADASIGQGSTSKLAPWKRIRRQAYGLPPFTAFSSNIGAGIAIHDNAEDRKLLYHVTARNVTAEL
ncbi:uncharacterized protein C8Q71DRAFT_725016 [Rhodofomes roseus]|uniref:Uncharacterized protein n=1 Tax=Rhodofomes roseus TaxID=34475 RepID=A0ABQ8KA89_9APHY|nr:uncharacterized protein C8Q71DRAFT_725016 [Rhodofomes roseus]KAH9834421.1 hypothetical protein C8Q71DRAFT_725016 [Rhodofomes roseus]